MTLAILLADTDWTYADGLEQLKEDMSTVADVCRQEETKKLVLITEVSPLK